MKRTHAGFIVLLGLGAVATLLAIRRDPDRGVAARPDSPADAPQPDSHAFPERAVSPAEALEPNRTTLAAGDEASQTIVSPQDTPETASSEPTALERKYAEYLKTLETAVSLDQWRNALVLVGACITAELDAQGLGEKVSPTEGASLKSTYEGEVRMTSHGKLFAFDERQYPLYARVRNEFWAMNKRESQRQQSNAPASVEREPSLPEDVKSDIEAMVQSALKLPSVR